MVIVLDKLHYRDEAQWLREAILALSMENLDQLVIPPFPRMVTDIEQYDLKFGEGIG